VTVERFHLFRYLDEQAYRFNNRKEMTYFERFELACSQLGKRLSWDSPAGKQSDPQTSINWEGTEKAGARQT
jgi:hypothetical protein